MKNKMLMRFLAMTMAVTMLAGNITPAVAYASGRLNKDDSVSFLADAADSSTSTITNTDKNTGITQTQQPTQTLLQNTVDNSVKLGWPEGMVQNYMTEREHMKKIAIIIVSVLLLILILTVIDDTEVDEPDDIGDENPNDTETDEPGKNKAKDKDVVAELSEESSTEKKEDAKNITELEQGDKPVAVKEQTDNSDSSIVKPELTIGTEMAAEPDSSFMGLETAINLYETDGMFDYNDLLDSTGLSADDIFESILTGDIILSDMSPERQEGIIVNTILRVANSMEDILDKLEAMEADISFKIDIEFILDTARELFPEEPEINFGVDIEELDFSPDVPEELYNALDALVDDVLSFARDIIDEVVAGEYDFVTTPDTVPDITTDNTNDITVSENIVQPDADTDDTFVDVESLQKNNTDTSTPDDMKLVDIIIESTEEDFLFENFNNDVTGNIE